VILMEMANFARHFHEEPVQSLAVYLNTGAEHRLLEEEFTTRFSGKGEFIVYSSQKLRERIFGIFDQTFAVTYVLRTVAIIVAVTGIFLSVTTLVAERERELGMLRAIGASRGQIQQLFMTEAALIGFIASVLGILAGGLLSVVLTWVVNPAFFGWTIRLQIPWMAVLATPLWIVPAALAASWWPAWRGSRKPVSAAVREE
jgi:putative ABC transport system permease protein